MDSEHLKPFLYTFAVVFFIGVMIFMFLHNTRAKKVQNRIEGNREPASKEAGIMEAQEAMKRERQEKHG